jgi:hypothetical protein
LISQWKIFPSQAGNTVIAIMPEAIQTAGQRLHPLSIFTSAGILVNEGVKLYILKEPD